MLRVKFVPLTLLPKNGVVFISLKEKDKKFAAKIAEAYTQTRLFFVCYSGTCKKIKEAGYACELVYKI